MNDIHIYLLATHKIQNWLEKYFPFTDKKPRPLLLSVLISPRILGSCSLVTSPLSSSPHLFPPDLSSHLLPSLFFSQLSLPLHKTTLCWRCCFQKKHQVGTHQTTGSFNTPVYSTKDNQRAKGPYHTLSVYTQTGIFFDHAVMFLENLFSFFRGVIWKQNN